MQRFRALIWVVENRRNLLETLPHEKLVQEHMKAIEHLKKQNQSSLLFTGEIRKLEEKLEKVKEKVYSELSPWERVMISRHPQRPHSLDYIQHLATHFQEL